MTAPVSISVRNVTQRFTAYNSSNEVVNYIRAQRATYSIDPVNNLLEVQLLNGDSVRMENGVPHPSAAGGTILTFILAMNAYATPVLIGGPTMHMMGPAVYEQISKANNWPLGSTLACILVTVTMALTVLSGRMLARRRT